MRLYDPTQGEILINGINLKRFEIESVRRTIGVCFQEFMRFPFTAAENIGLGCVQRMKDMKRIEVAARKSQAHAAISRLRDQYSTVLSNQFQQGHELSLGQWQRICLARLFMKDSPVLILDEPTASMDVESEASVMREIHGLAPGKICIMIAHRMFKKGVADRILVFEKGRIVEEGIHEELIEENRLYARLWACYNGAVFQAV